jgi:hypothetical protein
MAGVDTMGMARKLVWHYSALFERNSLKFYLIFSFALFLRALPEFFSGSYPVGFDALSGYVPAIFALPDISPMKAFGWAYSPLSIYLLWFVRVLTGVDTYLLLKIAGPIFYGLFCVSFCYMLSHGLGWSNRKSFFVALLLLLQPAVLRMGWDQLREELGLIFLFVLLAVTKCKFLSASRFKVFSLLSLSILIVLSHQLVALLLFVIVSWQLLNYLPKKDSTFLGIIVTMLPSVLIFVWQLYSQFLNPVYSNHFAPLQLPIGSGNFVFTNYFLSDHRFFGGNYWTVFSHVGCLLLYTTIPLIPFAVKGFFKDKVFMPMLIWLLPFSLSILVYPWYALSQYWWCILLLPIPLTVYLGEYLDKKRVFENTKTSKSKKIYWAALLMLGVLAVGYAGSSTLGYSYITFGYPYAYTYLPTGLVQSSIPFEDIPDVKAALEWMNTNAPLNSTLIVQEKIQGLAYIELRSDFLIRVSPSLLTLNEASKLNPATLISYYAVWYIENVDNGTFSGSRIIQFGKIGVFEIYKR